MTKLYLMYQSLFETENCHVHRSLANPRTFHDQRHFQDFPGPGNFPLKIPGLSRKRGNPELLGYYV